jgi:mono/diheme cytochrome c family protein
MKAKRNAQPVDTPVLFPKPHRSTPLVILLILTCFPSQLLANKPAQKSSMKLFLGKCSACHNPGRALTVIKDPDVWEQTILRMQVYSKGRITSLEAKELVRFHVSLQQKEIGTFRNTCTQCHDDQRINSRSLSEEQWLATIRRMQEMAPKLISNEKVTLLSAYFHRRELTMARIFSRRCNLCHRQKAPSTRTGSGERINGLVAMASSVIGDSLDISHVNNHLAIHKKRQKKSMQLYERNCRNCHTEGAPKKKSATREPRAKRSRSDWISFIADHQTQENTKHVQETINGQIDYHLSRH